MMKSFVLDAAAMLALWKRAHGYEPLRTDCVVTRTDGPDLDAVLGMEMRAWYAQRLLTDDPRLLPLTDIGPMLTLTATPSGDAVSSPLPDGCLRVAEVMVPRCARPALIVESLSDPLALAQSNPYACGGEHCPVAVVSRGSITVYGPRPAAVAGLKVLAVTEPADADTFPMTRALVSAMINHSNY